MRKKLIAMIGAMIGLVAMATVANAGTVTVDYDAVNSTNTVAKYIVYTSGVSGTSRAVGIDLVFTGDTVVNLSEFSASNVEFHEDVQSLTLSAKANVNQQKIRINALSTSANVTYDETKPFMTFSLPVKSNTQKSNIDAAAAGVTGVTFSFEQILPQSAKVTGTVVDEVPDSDPATYFKVENAPLSGTAWWYADFAGTAKKVKANVPNTQGTANLGFVYTGTDAPTSVKIVCE